MAGNLAYADIVATVALVASFGGLWLHWLAHRKDRRNAAPIILAELRDHIVLPDGWSVWRVTLQSRSNEGVRIRAVTLKAPRGSRIDPVSRAVEADKYGGWFITASALPGPGSLRCPSTLRVSRVGVDRATDPFGNPVMGSGEEHHEDFILFCAKTHSSLRARKLIRSWRFWPSNSLIFELSFDSSPNTWRRRVARLTANDSVGRT
jgi:hypothetical protein